MHPRVPDFIHGLDCLDYIMLIFILLNSFDYFYDRSQRPGPRFPIASQAQVSVIIILEEIMQLHSLELQGLANESLLLFILCYVSV